TYIFIDGTLVGGTSIGSTGRFGTTIPKQPADGPHRIEVAAEYLGAWSSTTAARNFTLDTVAPPTPVILVPAPDSWVASTTPTFSGTAEPLSKLSLNVSTRGNFTATTDASGHWSFTMPSALDDGLDYILSVRATDAASNGSDLATVSFMVDATVPETTLGQTPSDPSTSSSTTFTFSSNETGAGFECSVDDAAFTACTSPATFTLSDGQHTFQVRARDLAGNVDATPASFSWTLDTGAPDVTITEKPASVTNATSAKLVFGSTDRGSSFECSVDGAAFSSCTSPVDLTGLAEGKHSFKVQARDVVGNVSTAPATWEWTVDVTAPVAPVITAPTEGQAFESGTVSITGTAEAGSKVRVFIKGTEAGSVTADGSGNWSFTPATAFANGSYTVKATATDAANNVSAESGERTFTVDVKSPGTGGGGDEPESCGCSSPAGDPASALMALAGLAAFVSRRRRK
ncbi:Ig-like domain-containing protein, partial [Archangium sp.]|uniref:Ig-like domain-containing protein n=1 Tax=Archangium sp. TaxID=1872627 RepID=UPI00389AE749